MAIRGAALTAILVLATPALGGPSFQGESGPVADPDAPPIRFEPDLGRARKRAAAEGRPLVLLFTTSWCPSCRRFERETLTAAPVRAAGRELVWVRADTERQVSLARSYWVDSTLEVLVLSPEGTLVARLVGWLEPAEFVEFLDAARARLLARDGGQAHDLHAPAAVPHPGPPLGFRGRSICYQQVGYGPLHLASQSPGQVLRLGLEPFTPSTLARGQVELAWSETLVNVFGQGGNQYLLDYESLMSTLGVAWGLTDTLQLQVGVRQVDRFGGLLDGLSQAYHDLFGISQNGRDLLPKNQNVIQIATDDGDSILVEDSGTWQRDLSLTLQHNITCGSEYVPALAWSVTARYDAGGSSGLEGPSPWSLGLSLSTSKRFGEELYGYLGLGYALHGRDEWLGIELRDRQLSALLATEWRYSERSSLLLQYLLSEAVAESQEPFDDTTHEITLGYKREVTPGTVLELGLIENNINFDNSPDFGLHFGLRHRF